ncbi:uncharacterized protein LOC129802125 [Phlebotomus papatasi]|uniref:uncharacterized protein LOC129802125 n=1 Tax=Phlebotomus papatasi TaxID=29031 RepID=UPI0024836DFE|nr:uncharacterized protein LOC129802125 [Phlebotomus papatasi]
MRAIFVSVFVTLAFMPVFVLSQQNNLTDGTQVEESSRLLDRLQNIIKNFVKKLLNWIKKKYEELKETILIKEELIKEILKELIKHFKDIKAEVAKEVLEYLEPYKKDFGTLYNQFIAGIKEVIKKDE